MSGPSEGRKGRRIGVRRALLVVTFIWVALSCTGPEPREAPPPEREGSAEQEGPLKRRFTDGSLPAQERMDAGAGLLELDGGPAFIASLYRGKDRNLVQGVLDSAEAKSPAQAARLAAQLMAVARGEEKLAFESFLLERGNDAVAPLIELLEEPTDWQTAVQALDALGNWGQDRPARRLTRSRASRVPGIR